MGSIGYVDNIIEANKARWTNGTYPSQRILKFGVIGIGRIGQQHALNILSFCPRAQLVCACSPAQADLDWAEVNLVPHNVSVYRTVDEMLQYPELDAVVIASITELHYEHTIAALGRGIHVLCEKPISPTADELQHIIDMVDSRPGSRVMCGFTRRFDENYREAAQKIKAGKIGSPVVIRSQGCEKLSDEPFMHDYVVNAARGGGFFVDSFVHDIDLTLFLLEADGKNPVPQSVCAFGTSAHFKQLDGLGDADNAIGVVQFWDGQISFHYNSRTAAAGYDNQTEIFGTRGKISINLVSKSNRLELSDGDGIHTAALPSWYDRYKPSFVTEVCEFTDAVLDQKPMPVPLHSCLVGLKIAQAMQESMRTNKKVNFDENGDRLSD